MKIERIKEFQSVSQRVLYGFKFVYSDFSPISSEIANELEQKNLHEQMSQIINKMFEEPSIINLPDNPDEAYEWHLSSNQKPDLSAVYLSVYKGLYEFYRFFYITSLHGEVDGARLSISNETLKTHKAKYKPVYSDLLNAVGFYVTKNKNSVVMEAEKGLLAALTLLAKCVPTSEDKFYPYSLIEFVCCSFTGDKEYLLERIDSTNGLNGLLLKLKSRCEENGYRKEIELCLGSTDLNFNLYFRNEVGGFHIGFNSRKYQQFFFGTINGIGEKAMLEDFNHLSDDMKRYFINICKTCEGCLFCTKGGKNRIFAIKVQFNGKEYNLCPAYPRHLWETIDSEMIDVLFEYHDLQKRYYK